MDKLRTDNVEDRLEAELAARKAQTCADVQELAARMTPASLAGEVRDAVAHRVDQAADAVLDTVSGLADETCTFVRENRAAVGAGAVAVALAGAGVWLATRRQRRETVPIYAAYDFAENTLDDPAVAQAGDKAAGAWGRVRERTADAGQKAGEAYYAARSKAAALATEAQQASGEALGRARDAAGQAGQWAKQQEAANPVGALIGAASLGLLFGLLLPAGDRK